MDSLADLASCCRGINGEKVTDRKKSVEKLKNILQNNSVISNLDKNSDNKKSGYSWDDVFKAVCGYISIESEALQKGKETQSATALSNREKKKQEISGVFKLVIKQADKRGPRLKCSVVLKHIQDVLVDDFMCNAYGLDYSNILLKNILTVRKYWVDLNYWLEFIGIYCQMFKDPECGVEKVLLSRLIKMLILGATVQCDLRPKRLLNFFTETFNSIRQQKTTAITENLLGALNIFVKSIIKSSRVQICKLGENIFVNLLYLWNNRPSVALKNSLVEFLHTQLICHHPGGAKQGQAGCFAVDWETWMSHLKKLYEVIDSDMLQQGGRTKFTGYQSNLQLRSREAELSAPYLELAVDLCHQLFGNESQAIEITQNTENTQGPAKKRRLQTGWQVIRERFTQGQTTPHITWLQLICRLIEKYPHSFPEDECMPYLQCLSQLVAETKQIDVMENSLQCLQALIDNWMVFKFNAETRENCLPSWRKIWASTLRAVGLHHAEGSGYRLLNRILSQDIVPHERDIWSLFLPSISVPTTESVQFLVTYLLTNSLPEKYQPSIIGSVISDNTQLYPLRTQLLEWLLVSSGSMGDNSSSIRRTRHLDPEVVAQALALLVSKAPSSLPREHHIRGVYLTYLEKVHLQISHDFPLQEKMVKSKDLTKNKVDMLIPLLLKKMEEILKDEAMCLMDVIEVNVTNTEDLAKEVCLIVKLIYWLLKYDLISIESLSTLDVVLVLKNLMKKLASYMNSVLQNQEVSQILSVLSWLKQTLDWTEVNETTIKVARLCRSLIPAKIIETLLALSEEKFSKGASRSGDGNMNNSRLGASHRGHSRRNQILEDIDDMDLGFDDPPAEIPDLEIEDTFGDSQDSDEVVTQGGEFETLFSWTKLTGSQKARVEAVRILSLWCGFDHPYMKQMTTFGTNMDQTYIKSKVTEQLSQDRFDPTKPVDLQVMQVVVTNLTGACHKVADKDLDSMLNAIREVARHLRNDQEVCCVCLDLLGQLVEHLVVTEDEMTSKTQQDCMDQALHLFKAFWKLQEEGHYTSKVRLAIARCMMQFVKIDPKRKWTFLTVKDGDDGEEIQRPLADEFIQGVSDNSHEVRMYTAENITQLFMYGEDRCVPRDRKEQDRVFDKIYEILHETLTIPGNLSPDRARDESNNRTASVLTTLGNIICASPVCEKKALFALCQLIKECGVEVCQVQNVIKKASSVLGYKDGHAYISDHLAYIIHHWLKLGYLIKEFPYKITFCKTQAQFYKGFYEVIIPELIMVKDIAVAKDIVVAMGMDWMEVLITCIPKVVVHILPLFAASKSTEIAADEAVRKRTTHATLCYDLLSKEATRELVEKTIVDNLDKIVVNILMCLYDTDNDDFIKTDIFRDMDPEPNPPCFNVYMTKSTLDYLTKSFSGNMSLVMVLSRKQGPIQKILLDLAVTLTKEHRLHEKRRILLMYRLFCKLLFREFEHQLGGGWAFVMREVIYRLIYITKDMVEIESNRTEDMAYKENICCTALELLQELCFTAIEICPQEFEKYLPFIVSSLTPVAEITGEIGDKGLSILKMIVFDSYSVLKSGIISLDPFPGRDIYTHLLEAYNKLKFSDGEFTLKQDIEHFLALCEKSSCSSNNRQEGLRYLSDQLAKHQTEILQLARKGEDTPSESVLCRLICRLVHMVMTSSEEVKVNIACCLGGIGPIDMATVAMPTLQESSILKEAKKAFEDDVYLQNYCTVFHMLNQYLVDDNVEVVQAASSVLKSILSTKTGVEFPVLYKDRLGERDHLFQYLHPFRSKKKTLTIGNQHQVEHFCQTVDSDMLWLSTASDHAQWIQRLSQTLIQSGAVKDEVFALLVPICQRKTKICEVILPFLVHDIIVQGADTHKEVMSRQIANFFSFHCNVAGRNTVTPTGVRETSTVCYNKDSIRIMLKVVQYLRQQSRPREGRLERTAWDNNFWLDLNYLHIAKAALFCSAHFTTVLYSEIWCDIQRHQESEHGSQGSQKLSQSFTQDTRIDSVSSASCDVGINVQDLLMKAYQEIGDPDGLYGCGAGRLADASSRVKTYQHENLWDKAVITHDIDMNTAATTDSSLGILKAFQNFGALHTMDAYFQGMSQGTELPPSVKELQYQAAWKTGQWSLDPIRSESSSGYHQAVYSALSAVKDGHTSLVLPAVNTARLSVIQRLCEGSMESARCLYPMLADLHCVSQIQAVLDCDVRDDDAVKMLVRNWSDEDEDVLSWNDFEFVEPVYSMRISLLKLILQKTESRSVCDCLQHQLVQLARLCRGARRHQLAERAVFQLKSMDTDTLSLHVAKQIEEANMFWARQEHDIAKHLMKDIIHQFSKVHGGSEEASRYHARVLSIYGNWLAETRSENPNVIMEEYLEKTVGLLEEAGEEDEVAVEAYLSLARYADSQYQHIVNYMKSNTYEAKCSLMKKAQIEIEKLKQLASTNKQFDTSKDRYFKILDKQSEIDKRELESMLEDKSRFLVKAVENYLQCLKCGDKHDLRIFRLTSLWFNSVNNPEIMQIIQSNIKNINTYKFLPLMYQLAARMDTKPHKDQSPLFQQTLNHVIEQTAMDHPHHTLFCVLALAHAKKDSEIFKAPNTKKGKLSRTLSDAAKSQEEGRIESAKNLIQRLKSKQGVNSVAGIVMNMEKLCIAYIQLANFPVNQFKKETRPIPIDDRLSIKQVKNLSNVAVPTAEIPVDKSGNYDNVTYIQSFQPTFKLAGGINLPKIISCVGSDGQSYRQLVKGRDDLRQDAVMQQVFAMVNTLLKKNTETRKRRLHIRKYKVIPLSQCSGLLEWCEGTLPLGEYLMGGSSGNEAVGAHRRYRPQDQSARQSREQLATVHTASAETKYKTFLKVCHKFQPVFRHFFMEKFPDPSHWYERRLAYTKSVATNSIVGYILGLGDRHVQNILIDCITAEMVHIDLGVAFEQGRILPTPETVPFRLTRDIVDGMGVSGAEGVFRRCCEKTMEVMHGNQEALLTILEVLLYDPLYAWSMSPAKAYALQHRRDRNDPEASELNTTSTSSMLEMTETDAGENQDNVNKLAERVLLRLQQKLQGIEEGVQLSVGGQVNHLIQEARDPKNLCRLFPGWQPYL